MLLADWQIRRALALKRLVIDPLDEALIQPNGVDIRMGSEFKFLDKTESFRASSILLEPHRSVLCTSYETFRMPNDLTGIICLKSSYARRGLLAPTTVIDSGYYGRLTLVLTAGSAAIELRSGEPIWYLLLARSAKVKKPYSGKYQGIDVLSQ